MNNEDIDINQPLFKQYADLEKKYPKHKLMYEEIYKLYSRLSSTRAEGILINSGPYKGRRNKLDYVRQLVRNIIDVDDSDLLSETRTKLKNILSEVIKEHNRKISSSGDIDYPPHRFAQNIRNDINSEDDEDPEDVDADSDNDDEDDNSDGETSIITNDDNSEDDSDNDDQISMDRGLTYQQIERQRQQNNNSEEDEEEDEEEEEEEDNINEIRINPKPAAKPAAKPAKPLSRTALLKLEADRKREVRRVNAEEKEAEKQFRLYEKANQLKKTGRGLSLRDQQILEDKLLQKRLKDLEGQKLKNLRYSSSRTIDNNKLIDGGLQAPSWVGAQPDRIQNMNLNAYYLKNKIPKYASSPKDNSKNLAGKLDPKYVMNELNKTNHVKFNKAIKKQRDDIFKDVMRIEEKAEHKRANALSRLQRNQKPYDDIEDYNIALDPDHGRRPLGKSLQALNTNVPYLEKKAGGSKEMKAGAKSKKNEMLMKLFK